MSTVLTGFLGNFLMLKMGLTYAPLRYPLGVLLSYGAFLKSTWKPALAIFVVSFFLGLTVVSFCPGINTLGEFRNVCWAGNNEYFQIL